MKWALTLKNSIEFVKDRPGHDFRYSIDNEKVSSLVVGPPDSFDKSIRETVLFYTGAK